MTSYQNKMLMKLIMIHQKKDWYFNVHGS